MVIFSLKQLYSAVGVYENKFFFYKNKNKNVPWKYYKEDSYYNSSTKY